MAETKKRGRKPKPTALPDILHASVASSVCAEGIWPHPFVWLDDKGQLHFAALDLQPPQAIALIRETVIKPECVQAIYAFDRFAGRGQGTTLGDLMAGVWLDGEGEARPFIIEYRHAPRLVKPIDYANRWWNQRLKAEAGPEFRRRRRAAT